MKFQALVTEEGLVGLTVTLSLVDAVRVGAACREVDALLRRNPMAVSVETATLLSGLSREMTETVRAAALELTQSDSRETLRSMPVGQKDASR